MKITNLDIDNFIRSYMAVPENNNMKDLPLPAFAEPLVAFSRGSDPLYEFYREHIDREFYRTPAMWLEVVYGRAFDPEKLSVISWFLPQTDDTKEKIRALGDCPPLEWMLSRIYGEECNRRLAKAVETMLRENGIAAVAPMCSDEFSWGESEKFLKISNWSERHTAYISGLGTFGLCDGLITEKGKAGRFGSVIVELELDSTERKYSVYNEYCQAKNGCRACIERCPAGAISEKGHDKAKCIAYHAEIKALKAERYGHDGYGGHGGCGLCQTGVPCESCIPGRK